jgi:phospholipase D
MKKPKLTRATTNHILKFFNFSKTPIRSIIAVFMLGVGSGVAYEEMFGIGTWHSYHPDTDLINLCFTPPSGCGSLIAQEITKAKRSIYVQAYGLTSYSIINQLKLAKRRGIDVHVLLDGGNLSDNKDVELDLKSAGISVYYDKMPGIAHNKVMIIDKQKVITGSFNFTNAADTKNAENVLLIEDKNITKTYLMNWQKRFKSAKST